MKLNRISRLLVPGLLMLGLLMSWSGEIAAQTLPQPTPSASPSPSSDTRASEKPEARSQKSEDEALRRACADAIAELRAARKLIDAQGVEIQRYDELLRLEREIAAKYRQITTLSDQEKAELRSAIDAKDRQIASLEAALAASKKNRWTFWKNAKAVTLGVAAGIVIAAVLRN